MRRTLPSLWLDAKERELRDRAEVVTMLAKLAIELVRTGERDPERIGSRC